MAALNTNRAFSQFVCLACRQRIGSTASRAFTTTATRHADGSNAFSALSELGTQMNRRPPQRNNRNSPLSGDTAKVFENMLDSSNDEDVSSILSGAFSRNLDAEVADARPHRLHVYATKHNTHITFVQPPMAASQMARARMSGASTNATQQKKVVDMVMSLSTGNIGFRKAGRGSYDAAYQLAAFILKQLAEKGHVREIRKLEVVLRGFGAGREAVTKALLGTEGRHIRDKISAVVDATRLKQGGPRAPKPRRLG